MTKPSVSNTLIPPLLLPQKPKTGRPASDYPCILNGIIWIQRTGAAWRDLPERYGPWGTVASRFYCWRKVGIWQRLFEAAQQQAEAAGQIDWTLHDVEATIVRVYQHAISMQRARPEERNLKPWAKAKRASAPKCICERQTRSTAYFWRLHRHLRINL